MKAEEQHVMVVRHPETVANRERRYIGRVDSPLTAEGEAEVAWLFGVVAEWRPEIIYSSPLARAANAARAVSPANVPLEFVRELEEIDFGAAEGHTHAELASLGIHLDYASGGPIVPGGERGDAFYERVREVGERIRSGGQRALVITHGGVMRHLLTCWLELPFADAWRFSVPNASVALVRLGPGFGALEGLTAPPGKAHRTPWLR